MTAVALKSSMREAFEMSIIDNPLTPLLRRIQRRLNTNNGITFRKQMWFVKRNK